jgi:hypothetical protein
MLCVHAPLRMVYHLDNCLALLSLVCFDEGGCDR